MNIQFPSFTTLNGLLPFLCKQGASLFRARISLIRLLTEGQLVLRAWYGSDTDVYEIAASYKEIAEKAILSKQVVLVDDLQVYAEQSQINNSLDVKSNITALLMVGDVITGTFELFDKVTDQSVISFSHEDLQAVTAFAAVSAIAVDNTRRYEFEIEKSKKTDQLKEFLECIVDNSSDAVITLDRKGKITSWNSGAERVFGFKKEEVLYKSLPIIPDYLAEQEKDKLREMRYTGVRRERETVRKRRDGSLIELALNESPMHNSNHEVTGFCHTFRDISERRLLERELRRRNQAISKLRVVSDAMRNTLEMDRLLRMALAAVTMGDGLGFNRAILFFIDEESNTLRGKMGVGPISVEDAFDIWRRVETKTLEEVIQDIDLGPVDKESPFNKLCEKIVISLDNYTILTRAIHENKPFNIQNVHWDPLVDSVLTRQLGTEAFAVVPLISRGQATGLLWVDNSFNKKPITDEDFKFLIGFVDNVATSIENARLFEQVSLAQVELANIFESITDMMFFNDKDFNIKQINQAVVDKIGLPSEEIVGKKCYKIFHNMDKPLCKCPHYKTIQTGKAYIEEMEDVFLGGVYIISSSPIFDASGELKGTVHISRDVTDFRQMQERLAKAERKAALGEMAAQVAHEIRNPLTPIGGFARHLEKRLDGKLKDYAKIIVEEVNRLESILKDTLSFVKESRIDKRPVNINALLDDIVNLMKNDVIKNDNSLVKKFYKEPLIVSADYNCLKEALLNIVVNANQATQDGIITVHSLVENKKCLIMIEDTGCGIKPEDLSRIFDPFFTTRIRGTGLGLAITNRIIEEHKGTIEVESSLNKGTRFKIYLLIEEE
ncbi:MAG TPA: PAS domain S-box protein [Thermodesulfovibrionia bacterium]|nr:PAS domain S-box protein [Thermodesulfovibrionia bacterium]